MDNLDSDWYSERLGGGEYPVLDRWEALIGADVYGFAVYSNGEEFCSWWGGPQGSLDLMLGRDEPDRDLIVSLCYEWVKYYGDSHERS